MNEQQPEPSFFQIGRDIAALQQQLKDLSNTVDLLRVTVRELLNKKENQ